METQVLKGSDTRTVSARYLKSLLDRPDRAAKWELFILFQIGEEPPEVLTGVEALKQMPLHN